VDGLIRDVRYALRGLRKAPGFTLVAVATLALGIGANSTIFSLVNAVIFRPLPVERPEELVAVYGRTATSSTHDSNSYPNFLDYRARAETLEGMIAFTNFFANLSIDGSAELVIGEIVSEDYFPVLGVEAAEGRTFVPEEFAAPGAGPVAVLSHPFWQSRFAGDLGVLGRTFRMNGVPYTIVGVAPRGFGGMMPAVSAQMWIPLSMVEQVEPLGNNRNSGPSAGTTRLERRGNHFLWVKGRLAPGATVAQVRAELEAIAAGLAALHPETNGQERVTVLADEDVVINPDFDGTLVPAGMVLLGAVGLVLLVASANLANMMTARATARRREMALRLAVGADRATLVRQTVVESLTLSLAGGVVAVVLAYGFAGALARFQPPLPIDLALDVSPDVRVLVFTVTVAALTGLAFGLLPALRASRPDLVAALKDAGGGDEQGRRRWDPRDALVVVQVAVSLVLLVGGALMVRSLGAGARVDFGYDVDRVAHLALAMEMNGYAPVEAAGFIDEAKLRLEAMPEVEAVGMASRLPLELNNNGFGLFIDGHQSSPTDAPYGVDGARVDEGYFGALGIQIVAGRGIEAPDREENAAVAVVSETLASRYWPGQDPIGREFRTSWEGRAYRIVGVVRDYKVDTPGEAPKPYLHLPLPPEGSFANFVVKTTVPAAGLVSVLEAELRRLDPDLVFIDTGTLRQLAEVRLFPVRAAAWLIGAFGLLALVLAAVGLYGVVSYSVSRRVREMGIRKALGAETRGVVALVLRQGMLLVGVGGVAGALLALVGARALSAALLVEPYDPVSFAAAFLVLAAVGALANWVPARRAAAVDPMVALRSQ
jgi:predicted permease